MILGEYNPSHYCVFRRTAYSNRVCFLFFCHPGHDPGSTQQKKPFVRQKWILNPSRGLFDKIDTFRYAKDMKQVISLDLGGTSLKGALVDEKGAVGARERESTVDLNKDAMVAAMVGMIKKLQEQAKGEVAGVGVGSPGPLNPFDGVILITPNLPFKEPFLMKEVLEKEIGLKVVVNNDANMAVLGEAWKGAAAGAKNVVLLTLGTGIGGGLILNGELYMGSNGLGAELGHITIAEDGPLCGCGVHGCFEGLASGTAIINKAREEIDKDISEVKEVAGLYKENEAAKKIWEEEGKWLGIAVANYINIFNPEFVILGGAISGAWSLFEKRMMEEVEDRAFSMIADKVQVTVATLGNDAGIVGAARLVFDRR